MSDFSEERLSITGLPTVLNRIASDLSAVCVIAAGESGHVLNASKTEQTLDLPTLAALGSANLISSMQLLSLSKTSFAETGAFLGIAENERACVIVAGKKNGPVFIALLGEHSPLGLARLEMRELADMDWEIPSHNPDEERRLIDQQLASRNLFDELFTIGGDEQQ